MIENQIKQFITKYNNVSYLDKEDSGEGVLYGISLGFIDTTLFNEEQYSKWEKLLDSIDVIKPNYDNLVKKPTNFSRGMNCLIIFL